MQSRNTLWTCERIKIDAAVDGELRWDKTHVDNIGELCAIHSLTDVESNSIIESVA